MTDERPACPVEGCPGDGRYAPPGRGHTCTSEVWMGAVLETARTYAREHGMAAWLRSGGWE